jgi:TonB family protein
LRAARTARERLRDGGDPPPPYELRLLPAWPAPFSVFIENLSDLIRLRGNPLVEIGIAPDRCFWRNVDLRAPFPWRGLSDSVFVHAALLGLLYAASIWPAARVHLADSHSYRAIHGFQLSPYLPELHGAPTHRKQGGKADPVAARQEIRSVPDAPDNPRQTIVTPPKLKLQREVELPNLVAYKPPPAPPLDASSRAAILQLPATLPQMAERAPEIVQLKLQRAQPNTQPSVTAPQAGAVSRVPDLAQLLPPVANPSLPLRAAEIVQPQRAPSSAPPRSAQPAPELGSMSRGGAPNLAELLPQRAEPAPPAHPAGDAHMPQVVALSVHPAEVQAPVTLPEGNRRGAFAASPSGHAGATGAPGAGGTNGAGSHDDTGKVNAPPGISVGAPPAPAAAVAAPDAPAPGPATAEKDVRTKLLAAMRPPAIASIPPGPPMARQNTGKLTELENHIFAGRRSYTLLVNMPNLNVPIGSWIIRYVDRAQGLAPAPITAPEVVSKSDPAFPGNMIEHGIHGIVILTAIIRADGTVSDVAVAQSLFPELDQSAAEALSRWVFRPALKDGQPIDLEAVITVPFRTR